MHFSAERKRLIKVIEFMRRHNRNPRWLKLYSCSARVFMEIGKDVAGEEALVFSDGGVRISSSAFLATLKATPKKFSVTIRFVPDGVVVDKYFVRAHDYHPDPSPPADFVVGRVTDTWVGQNAVLPTGEAD